jgi:hypothetical protein
MKNLFLIVTGALCFGNCGVRAADKVDFVKDIQPILQQTCVKCHGPEKQKGKLRLDSKEATLKGGKDGPAFIASDAEKSEMYRRITLPKGNDDIMPNEGDPLTKAQTDLIRDWINQGATWPDGVIIQVAATASPSSTPAPPAVKLAEIKSSPAELAAIAKLETLGVSARPIAANVNWKEINLRMQGSSATDAMLVNLKDIATLVDLNLAGTKITDAGLANLAKLSNLTELHLEQTAVTDAGLAHLKGLASLVSLSLERTRVTDLGLVQLQALSGLR